ncbi:DUF302 domain-containing protein [Sagittula sp. SSi028]|uniref:DUF302 domain-containing protein n=1 Tax=Sagittula sp. SSi028 TaxID=3400636 RepID=UPI003AF48FD2
MFKWILSATAGVALTIATAAQADDKLNWVEAEGSVSDVMDRLEAAVTEAGATVFARVDHAGGADSVDMDLDDAELLIFGNPKLGTPVLQENIRAGVVLPLRVLVFTEEDKTWLIYQEVDAMLESVNAEQSTESVGKITEALKGLTEKAAKP